MPFTPFESVNLIIAIVGLFLTWWLQRPLKRDLNYQVLERIRAAEADHSQLVEMGVNVTDEMLDVADLLLVRFVSTGLGAIRDRDFGAPLELVFEQHGLVMEAVAVQKSPPNLRIDVATHRNVVTVSVTLLNPHDSFELTILVPRNCPNPTIQAHIEGAAGVVSVQRARRRRVRQAAYGLGLFAVAVLNLVGFYLYERQASFGLSDIHLSSASGELVIPIWPILVGLLTLVSIWVAVIFARIVSRLAEDEP